MFLQVVLGCRVHGPRLDALLRAKLARFGDQVLLADNSAFQSGEHRIRTLRDFLRAAGKEEINARHQDGHRQHGRETGLEFAIERESVAGHLFGDGERLKSGVRDLLAFFGDAHLFAQLVFGALYAQACAHAGQQFTRIERARDGVVRA